MLDSLESLAKFWYYHCGDWQLQQTWFAGRGYGYVDEENQ
jgi:hypothetical protein